LEEGSALLKPIPEFSLRAEELNHPVVAAEHLTSLGWSRFEEIDDILLLSQRINDFLSGQFLALNIRLISFKLEFGRLYTSDLMDSQIVITDEISPDTCNLLDLKTGKRLDRQGAQDNPDEAREIYQEVARRFGLIGLEVPETPMTPGLQDILASVKPSLKRSLNRRKSPNGHNSI
jgi:phosphoribosylaminoimidazole-succinocarboxamide synthase